MDCTFILIHGGHFDVHNSNFGCYVKWFLCDFHLFLLYVQEFESLSLYDFPLDFSFAVGVSNTFASLLMHCVYNLHLYSAI